MAKCFVSELDAKSKWIKISGKIVVEDDRVSIDLPLDLCKYYLWHCKRATWNTLPLLPPKYGAHISVILPHIHKLSGLCLKLQDWHKKTVDIYYDPAILIGGMNGGFTNFYALVYCPEINQIKQQLNIKEPENYYGDHVTFCTTKQFRWRHDAINQTILNYEISNI